MLNSADHEEGNCISGISGKKAGFFASVFELRWFYLHGATVIARLDPVQVKGRKVKSSIRKIDSMRSNNAVTPF